MQILIVGAAGMLGRKLVQRLAHDGALAREPIHHVTLADAIEPQAPRDAGFEVDAVVGDLANTSLASDLVSGRPDVVFHLAAVVSGEAEADFDAGYRVNLDGTRLLLDAVRRLDDGYRPRVVFSSSIAVFGPPLPDVIGDDHCTTPSTSYGTQKAIAELLLSDYTRRGHLDGVGIRLPTICVRPGAPVATLFAEVEARFGRLDLLFNNAGIGAPPVPLEDLELEDWAAVVETNVTGVFLCTQHAFRLMKGQTPRGGRIINNGSISASVPRPLSAPYTAAKHAVTGLTKSTSLDGRAYSIACGQIDVGNAATELAEPMRTTGVLQPDGTVRREPTIDVGHVARAVVYMASLPLEANVQFLTVMATTMPYIGRG